VSIATTCSSWYARVRRAGRSIFAMRHRVGGTHIHSSLETFLSVSGFIELFSALCRWRIIPFLDQAFLLH